MILIQRLQPIPIHPLLFESSKFCLVAHTFLPFLTVEGLFHRPDECFQLSLIHIFEHGVLYERTGSVLLPDRFHPGNGADTGCCEPLDVRGAVR